jgi:hypothetical protein
MDYLLGFLVAIAAFLFFRLFGTKVISKDFGNKIRYRQTHIHEIIKYNYFRDKVKMQAQNNAKA